MDDVVVYVMHRFFKRNSSACMLHVFRLLRVHASLNTCPVIVLYDRSIGGMKKDRSLKPCVLHGLHQFVLVDDNCYTVKCTNW